MQPTPEEKPPKIEPPLQPTPEEALSKAGDALNLTPKQQERQQLYRDARTSGKYSEIWQSTGKCVFCDLREKYIFFEEHGVVMTISLFAYVDGHFMIIPRRHVRSPKELTQQEWDTVRKFAYIAKKIIKETHGISAMQIVQKEGVNAQSTVDQHLHFHCIPFDAPDLCVWNYRQLKHTPLENVALYKKQRKKIVEHAVKFDKKYRQPNTLRVICDAIIMNEKREVLFQERPEDAQLEHNYLTLPGGGVEDFTTTLEVELAREVKEETGLDITSQPLKLVASRIAGHAYKRLSPHLNVRYNEPVTCLWNMYYLEQVPDLAGLTPGDDCSGFVWIPFKEAATHPRLSPEMRETFKGLKL